jgi:hypothetical protein
MSAARVVRQVLAFAAVTAAVLAQGTGTAASPPPGRTAAPAAGLLYDVQFARYNAQNVGDYHEERLFGGGRFLVPALQLEIRSQNGLLLLDAEATQGLLHGDPGGLPRRGVPPPSDRRRLSFAEMRARMERTLAALGRSGPELDAHTAQRALDLVRYIYFEGGVTVLRAGVEVVRCERLWISPLDDRLVVEDVELRYQGEAKPTAPVPGGAPAVAPALVVRGARLEKTGARWLGRDLELTTCSAGVPHFAMQSGQVEIRESDGEFEVFARGQRLQVGGTTLLPLPDAHFFTGSQTQFPVRRASVGYSGFEGAEAQVVLGLPWNSTGGAIHEALTGRPAQEFRGDWEFGVGYLENRGAPLRGSVEYRGGKVYEGRTDGFWLDDTVGITKNRREVIERADGSPIDNRERSLVRTQNRVWFGDDTHLDLQAFAASDAAVLSEFYGGDYRGNELPETSAYLHHGVDNHLFTVGTRFNLDRFSYRDNRTLAPRFVEESPVVTWNWVAQPIADLPWGTPLVLDTATELGQRRSDYDARAERPAAGSDRTFRADQRLELSAAFRLWQLSLRPFAAWRGTYYDNTRTADPAVYGGAEGRTAWDAGIEIGSRLQRTWHWVDEAGAQALRHVIAPKLTFLDRFGVDDGPERFHQFDATDALRDQNLVRFEVRNLLQRTEPTANQGPAEVRDLVLLDLAQDLWPNGGRDNQGDHLGLFRYDLRLRPRLPGVPFQTVQFGLYGDHDWRNGLRTLDAEVQFGPVGGVLWTAEYRTDQQVAGAAGLSASTRLFERWDAVATGFYDLERDRFLTWEFGLRRNDHDWSVAVVAGYDPYTQVATFRIDFQPTLGGLIRRPNDRFGTNRFQSLGNSPKW